MFSHTPMSAADLQNFYHRYEEFERRAAELYPANRVSLMAALSAAAITRVVVTFDGSGDSGQIEAVEAWSSEKEANLPSISVKILQLTFDDVEPSTVVQPLPEAIETLAYHYLGQTHGGWENNDGAYGEFIFDVAAGTITLDYNERFSDSTLYCHEF